MSSPTLVPGQLLEGKYAVGRVIGKGAMGMVCEGHHTLLDKPVAIKVLHDELGQRDDVRARFEAEARAAAALRNPHIVTVTDMGRTPGGALFLVMDRLVGETLAERLGRDGKLSVDASLAIIDQVLDGLEAAHGAGLVHRDLKPDNVFLETPEAGRANVAPGRPRPGGVGDDVDDTTARPSVRLLDFGVAKALAETGRRTSGPATEVGVAIGTPQYMAPEQARGLATVDHRADLYAVGVMLYEMLAGKRPFDGANAVAVLAAVLTDTPAPLSAVAPHVPTWLGRLVDTLIARDPDRRPASARGLRRALAQRGTVPTAHGRDALTSPRGAATTGAPARPLDRGHHRGDAADSSHRGDAADTSHRGDAADTIADAAPTLADPGAPMAGFDFPATPMLAGVDGSTDAPPGSPGGRSQHRAPPPGPGAGPSGARAAAHAAAHPSGVDLASSPLVRTLADQVGMASGGPRASTEGPRPTSAPEPGDIAASHRAWNRAHRQAGGPGVVIAALVFVVLLGAIGGGVYLVKTAAFSSDAEKPTVWLALPTDDAVLITVEARPKDATLTLDGQPLPSNPLRLPRAKAPRRVAAFAEGYRPAEVSFTPDRDRTVVVTLERGGGARRR